MTTYFPSYCVEVMSTGVDVVVRYNDWPFARQNAPEGETKSSSMRLNSMTLDVTNLLTIHAKPPKPDQPFARNAFIYLRMFRMLADDDLVFVYQHRWENAVRPLVGAKDYVEVARHEQSWTRTFGRWKWEDGRFYMPEDRPEIIGRLEEIQRALARGDVSTYVELNRTKLDENNRATGKSDEATEEERKLLEGMTTAPGWQVDPINPDDIVLESCAHGRLVQVFTKDGKVPVKAKILGQNAIGFPMMFGCVDGRWLPVR